MVGRLLATEDLWVRIQASLKNTKMATKAQEWPTNCNPPKKNTKKCVKSQNYCENTLVTE
jgi:hypothetical protein